MTDVLTPEQRRRNMQNIHQKDTSIELCLRKALWKKGYRYRKNVKTLPKNLHALLFPTAVLELPNPFREKNYEQ